MKINLANAHNRSYAKIEAMLIRKSSFIGPLPTLYFGSGIIRIVESSTRLAVKLDCRLSWSEHVSQVRKCFTQSNGRCNETDEVPPCKDLTGDYF